MGKISVYVRYHEKFGERIGIPMGWPNMKDYEVELERCIEQGTPFDGEKYFPPLPNGAVI